MMDDELQMTAKGIRFAGCRVANAHDFQSWAVGLYRPRLRSGGGLLKEQASTSLSRRGGHAQAKSRACVGCRCAKADHVKTGDASKSPSSPLGRRIDDRRVGFGFAQPTRWPCPSEVEGMRRLQACPSNNHIPYFSVSASATRHETNFALDNFFCHGCLHDCPKRLRVGCFGMRFRLR